MALGEQEIVSLIQGVHEDLDTPSCPIGAVWYNYPIFIDTRGTAKTIKKKDW